MSRFKRSIDHTKYSLKSCSFQTKITERRGISFLHIKEKLKHNMQNVNRISYLVSVSVREIQALHSVQIWKLICINADE